MDIHGKIYKVTSSQIGVFFKESLKMDETRRKTELLNAWLGFNSDQKNIRKLLEEKSIDRLQTTEDKQRSHQQNFYKLAAFMQQVR